jgi:hypothetical protein
MQTRVVRRWHAALGDHFLHLLITARNYPGMWLFYSNECCIETSVCRPICTNLNRTTTVLANLPQQDVIAYINKVDLLS